MADVSWSTACAIKLFLFGLCFCSVESVLKGAFILPHGSIALDPNHFNTTNTTAKLQAWEIHETAKEVGRVIASLNPEIIILSTPHGIAAKEDFGFYMNKNGYGTVDTDNCVCPPCCYNISVAIDTNVTSNLVSFLEKSSKVTYLTAYGAPGGEEPFPLRWGEVIPLYFSKDALSNSKLVFLSHPSRRYTEDVAMIPELSQLGSDLYHFFNAMNKSVVMVISGDLAHTHLKSGPYGFSNASEPFDKACGNWVETLDSEVLLV